VFAQKRDYNKNTILVKNIDKIITVLIKNKNQNYNFNTDRHRLNSKEINRK